MTFQKNRAKALGLLLAVGGLLQTPAAVARPEPGHGRLIAAFRQYCPANGTDALLEKRKAGPGWRKLKELPYELLGPMGGPFTSYDAWTVPQADGGPPILLVDGAEKGPGGQRRLCGVRGVEDGDVVAELRAVIGDPRAMVSTERLWGAFVWKDDGPLREPTDAEMEGKPENIEPRRFFTVHRSEGEASITVAHMVPDRPQPR